MLYFAALSGFMILLVTYLYDTFWKVQSTKSTFHQSSHPLCNKKWNFVCCCCCCCCFSKCGVQVDHFFEWQDKYKFLIWRHFHHFVLQSRYLISIQSRWSGVIPRVESRFQINVMPLQKGVVDNLNLINNGMKFFLKVRMLKWIDCQIGEFRVFHLIEWKGKSIKTTLFRRLAIILIYRLIC